MNVLVDFDFINFLREKYAMKPYPNEEDMRILDYCEAIIQNYHCNRGLKASFEQKDFETYKELKKLKERTAWGTE